MSVRSLNKVLLIGNLTRDPELRYTPNGVAVCSFGLATNRAWTTEAGEKKEDVEFHRIVAWNKLAELCSQLLTKGRKVFLEGRLQTRSWQTQEGQQRSSTEIVIDDMIILDPRKFVDTDGVNAQQRTAVPAAQNSPAPVVKTPVKTSSTGVTAVSSVPASPPPPAGANETVNMDDIPF